MITVQSQINGGWEGGGGLNNTVVWKFPGYLISGGGGGGVSITASGNILAGRNLCFRVFKLQLKVINKNICYLNSA